MTEADRRPAAPCRKGSRAGETCLLSPDVLDHGGALAGACEPGVALAAEQSLQATVGIDVGIDVRRDAVPPENDPGGRQADIALGKHTLAIEIAQALDLLARHDVDVVVEQLGAFRMRKFGSTAVTVATI
jgi:hypothetical protein